MKDCKKLNDHRSGEMHYSFDLSPAKEYTSDRTNSIWNQSEVKVTCGSWFQSILLNEDKRIKFIERVNKFLYWSGRVLFYFTGSVNCTNHATNHHNVYNVCSICHKQSQYQSYYYRKKTLLLVLKQNNLIKQGISKKGTTKVQLGIPSKSP